MRQIQVIYLTSKRVSTKCTITYRLRARNTFASPQGKFSRQCFSESLMSGEYFGRLIATGEWGCYLAVKYVTLKKYIFWKNL